MRVEIVLEVRVPGLLHRIGQEGEELVPISSVEVKADQVPIPLDEDKGCGDDRTGMKHFGGPLKVSAVMVDADVIRIADFIVVLANPVEGGRFVEKRIV